jgi:hypothetical protein
MAVNAFVPVVACFLDLPAILRIAEERAAVLTGYLCLCYHAPRVMDTRPTYKDFSKTLFWDVDPQEIDFDQNRRWFVVRVLEYGQIEDWKFLLKLFSLDEIVSAAQTARTLEPKALSFLSFVSGTPKESFRCFTMKP